MSPLGIPEEWTYNHSPGAGSQAKIIVPAAPGIAHVLTHLKARFVNNQNAAPSVQTVQVLDGVAVIWSWQVWVSQAAVGVITIDDLEVDLNLASTPDNPLTVQFTGTNAGFSEYLSINGHDV